MARQPSAAEQAAMVDSVQPNEGELARLRRVCREAVEEEKAIEAAEALLNERKVKLRSRLEREILDQFDAAGVSDLGVPPAHFAEKPLKVEVVPWYDATFPKEPEAREDAAQWMEENGHGELIKRIFVVTMGRGSENEAKALREILEKEGFDFSETESVHPSTYKAWVRERVEDYNEALPLDILNIRMGRVVKIKEVKEKVKKKQS